LNKQNFGSDNPSKNTGVGAYAGYYNVTGTANTCIGYEAGFSSSNVSRDYDNNTFVGNAAGKDITSGSNNTSLGAQSGESMTDGAGNVCIGHASGSDILGGSDNVTIGKDSGQAITTGNNNTIVGAGANTLASDSSHQIVLGRNTEGHGNDKLTFGTGDGSNRVHCQYTSGATFSHTSDERYKKDIKDTTDIGLDFINDLRTVTFKWKSLSEIDKDLPDYDETILEPRYDKKMYGLIAQEVKEALDNHNITDSSVWDIHEKSGIQSISNDAFVFPLIKAVQELSQQVEDLKKQINK